MVYKPADQFPICDISREFLRVVAVRGAERLCIDVGMKLYVPLTRVEFDQLLELARSERRRPQDQAAHLLGLALSDLRNTPTADKIGHEGAIQDTLLTAEGG